MSNVNKVTHYKYLGAILAAVVSVPAVAQGAPDAARGRTAFVQCVACHSTAKGAAHKIGPNLAGVAGAPAAAQAGYNYSPALKRANIRWDDAKLSSYLERPSRLVPGTKMAFPGVSDPARRRDLIAYMKTLR